MGRPFVMFAVFLALLLVLTPAVFGAYAVGVKAGDWVKYDVNWSTVGSGSVNVPPNLADWVKCTVVGVSGTHVTMEVVVRLANGSDSAVQTLAGDVGGNLGNLSYFFIPAGLEKADELPEPMYLLSGRLSVINDTVTRQYAGADRSVNVMSYVYSSTYITNRQYIYWDQATGFLVELVMNATMETQSTELVVKASETNMWSAGFFADLRRFLSNNLIYVLGTVAVVVVALNVAVLLTRRRKPVSTAEVQPNTDVVEKPA